ncbi:MAG: molybdopterin molybdotransferase MoeA [Rhodospirillales bacterium]|jgi:molybdopterin molybdotransferase|nr:molybdopterin molybdotransferase MoeA [Rhodospirillales bacterium]MBT4038801.1 molybdopterin molybdotransferase MoeA [Rhodospirillales bacterium]MBT4625092.1 molybdopterin molybdotransferase MoeA [Rhodospirillales bacterium]MBT5352973.1 molybdopterin molybdotransferase MoeA [Rhodospirillales bacterium]MBT5519728.1 molybdopterin molybdotransferase MoeA [Rhodospirillales bacterium]
MISVAEALERVTSSLKPAPHERIPVMQGLGRVLAEDVAARLTYPPTDISAMDGYAVIAADTTDATEAPAILQQIGESQAGHGFSGTVNSGETVRIFTGAPIPTGADAIVIQENTESDDQAITMLGSVEAGTFVRPRGLDITEGHVLRKAGHRLTARDLGLLASANLAELPVYRKPRIAYLATGDELVMPGQTIGPDQIISSNSIAIDACIRAFGGEPVSLGIAKDTPDSLRAALSAMDDVDMLVTIGGASVGDYDLVQSVLGDEGLELGFYKVAMRPGKPLIFGRIKGVPMLGLPGNPVSATVTSLLFLKPAMDILSGMPEGVVDTGTAVLGQDMAGNDQRQDYIRASLSLNSDGNTVVMPYGRQDSAMMSLLADSDCLIIRSPHAAPANAGDPVEIVRFGMANGAF